MVIYDLKCCCWARRSAQPDLRGGEECQSFDKYSFISKHQWFPNELNKISNYNLETPVDCSGSSFRLSLYISSSITSSSSLSLYPSTRAEISQSSIQLIPPHKHLIKPISQYYFELSSHLLWGWLNFQQSWHDRTRPEIVDLYCSQVFRNVCVQNKTAWIIVTDFAKVTTIWQVRTVIEIVRLILSRRRMTHIILGIPDKAASS